MKIACLISGLPRSIENNIDQIKNIFGIDIDYFLHLICILLRRANPAKMSQMRA